MASLASHTLPRLPPGVRWNEVPPQSAHGTENHGHGQGQDPNQDRRRRSGSITGRGRSPHARHNVATTLNYWADPGDGAPPLPITVGPTRVTNERPAVAVPVTVRDVAGEDEDLDRDEDLAGEEGRKRGQVPEKTTGKKVRYTLDTHGFQWVRHESAEKAFHDEGKIVTQYFAESELLLREVTGASRAHVFDHRVRRGPSYWHGLGENNVEARGPLRRAHVDQSYRGAELVLRKHWPAEADALLRRRWQIINIWRPIRTILQDPLAVADAASVPDADLAAAAVLHESGALKAETWAVRPNPAHRWYFRYRQAPDEVLLIKCFDSAADVARRAPHCAFEDPAHAGQEAAWRESVEVRALLFY